MSEMVEPVARAIAIALHPLTEPGRTTTLNELADGCARPAIEAHVAALTAAGYVIVPREATEAMDVAGRFRCHGVDLHDGSMRMVCGGFLGETAADQWRRMIDAALADPAKAVGELL